MVMRRLAAGVAALALTVAASAEAPQGKALEAAFDAGISSADQLEWLRTMASAPNQVGSPHDKANADLMMRLFREWGWDAHIETFEVLYPTPISTTVEMVAPERVTLGGQEPPVPGDDLTQNPAGALPPYVAYQGDGDVTADLVYVNYGMPDDYDALARRGIDVRGKIVIARYGAGWRGLKPLLAQWHGAAGCLIYSDPHEDGYAKGDPYPKGGFRPEFAVQRGSVMDMPIRPGDPLTPDVGATRNAKRLTRAQATTILTIPALPMSYHDASQLLARLGGPAMPAWQGSLPFTYHAGGDGAVRVHLAVKSDWSLKPVYDVIATLRGSTYPDQWVIRGNHHDGWVAGASDPLSGNVAMLAEAKALGALHRQGWRPKRTIVYTGWDGEEPALLGSTEWAEQHAAELQRKGLLYINSDDIERGLLSAGGSPEYQHLVNEAARDVVDPETGASVADRARAAIKVDAWQDPGHVKPPLADVVDKDADLPLAALGSGSDYTAYLQHLGLPSLDIGFGGEGASRGVYHSLYDSFHHYTTFDDPGMKYTAALSRMVGRVVLRVADADTPATRYRDFADTVATYLDEVKKLANERRKADAAVAGLRGRDAFRLAGDPLNPVGPPAPEPATPAFDFAPLDQAVARLRTSAAAYDAAYEARGAALAPARRARLNALLRDVDQLLLDERGLPGRPWFRNLVYAPGRLTGYGAKTLPGVREAIEDRRFDDATTFIGRTAAVLTAYAARLDQAATLLEGPQP